MTRSKRMALLFIVLAAVCVLTLAVLQLEEHREQIRSAGEVVLEIDPESVQALAWSYQGEDFSFHKGESWTYDGDEAFPVDGEKIHGLLEPFQALSAAFVIEEVEDYGQYGLDDPICTISLSTEEADYEIRLGDYSTMDAQRYLSLGDGNVYLVQNDPLDQYDAVLSDLILHDAVPDFGQVTEIQFSGTQEAEILYQEESGESYRAEDVYFLQSEEGGLPLDTDRVESYLRSITGLALTDYVTYTAQGEALEAFGLDQPELTVTVQYTAETEAGESEAGTFVLSLSRDPAERAAAEETDESGETEASEETEEEITAYARVGESSIVYQISGYAYEALMAASYDDLRHQEILPTDFQDIVGLSITLEGEEYTITAEGDEDERVYRYDGEEIDITDLRGALEELTASQFTDQVPDQKEEISLTLTLDREDQPEIHVQLYRYDGTRCLAVVDGVPTALIDRGQMVTLTEAVYGIVLS